MSVLLNIVTSTRLDIHHVYLSIHNQMLLFIAQLNVTIYSSDMSVLLNIVTSTRLDIHHVYLSIRNQMLLFIAQLNVTIIL